MAKLTDECSISRPGTLLTELINDLEIKRHYAKVPAKQANLDELVQIFNELDETALRPEASLRRITELLTLSNSVERQIVDADKVAVLTVHQAKGLQFDSVIIANAVEGAFPSKLNIKYEQFDEEARLFYVAMTRASVHLYITMSALDENGRQNASSRFIKYLPKAHYEKYIQNPSRFVVLVEIKHWCFQPSTPNIRILILLCVYSWLRLKKTGIPRTIHRTHDSYTARDYCLGYFRPWCGCGCLQLLYLEHDGYPQYY